MKILGLIVALAVVAFVLAPLSLGLLDGLFGMALGLFFGLVGGVAGLVAGLMAGGFGLFMGFAGAVFGLGVTALVLAAPVLVVLFMLYGAFKLVSAAFA